MNINIYLPEFIKNKLDEEVKKNGGSRSGMIAQILTNHWAETDETKNLTIKNKNTQRKQTPFGNGVYGF